MSGFLRIIGIINAAIWFGGGLFFAAFILPAVFSGEMRSVFHEGADRYYSGAVALVLFHRFFLLQYVCGGFAAALLLAEKFCLARPFPRLGGALVLVLLGLGLVGGLWLQPRMEGFRQTMYYGQTQELKDAGRRSFYLWHGVTQLTNVFILGGLLAHLIRVAQPTQPGRQGKFYQIP